MKFDQARQSILSWIENFVEVANPDLNGWPPCPFARRTRLEHRLDIRPGASLLVDGYDVVDTWNDRYDVVITVYSRHKYSSTEVADAVAALNKMSLPKDILFLDDHPDDTELVNNVCMNQGEYILVLTQRFSKVNDASADLKSQGYYKLWPNDYYDKVVGWRERYGFDDN